MRRVVPVLAVLLLAGTPVSADDFRDEKKRFDQAVVRPPLNKRRRAFLRFAKSKDPRALKIMAARYAKPRHPKEHEQYQLCNAIATHFTQDRHVATLLKLAKRYPKTDHAWLWHQCYRAIVQAGAVDTLEGLVRDGEEHIVRRSMALQALASRYPVRALRLVPTLLAEPTPKRVADEIASFATGSSVLLRAFEQGSEAEVVAAAESLVALFSREGVCPMARLVIARHLSHAYGTDSVNTDPLYWNAIIHHQESKPGDHTVVGRPRFFGVEASGRRVAYLVDMSDSMLAPLRRHEIDDAKTDAIEDPEHPIDWGKIKNRFDLARAYLIQSLHSLDDKASFVLIGFGKEAELFRTNKGIVKASRGNIKAAVAELKRIRPGKRTRKRPHGTLRGSTNLHGALLRAFRAIPGKVLDGHEHTDPKSVVQGVDTIYLFSDGKPTDDDFDAVDSASAGTVTLDRETGETGQAGGGKRNFYGPYQFAGPLLQDVDRLNVLRKAEIHAVAIGEADSTLLQGITQKGLGAYRPLGVAGRAGQLNAWWLLGPIAPAERKAWTREEPPEKKVELRGIVHIADRRLRWKRQLTAQRNGILAVKKTLGTTGAAMTYAYAEVLAPKAGPAKLWIGCDDGIRVWVNDKLVLDKLEPRDYAKDQDSFAIGLVEGKNRILVKLCTDGGAWRFAARITDKTGFGYDVKIR